MPSLPSERQLLGTIHPNGSAEDLIDVGRIRERFDPLQLGFEGLKGARNPELCHRLRLAMLANGVDIMGAPGGLVSAVHGPSDVDRTLTAFRTAVRWLKAEGDV